MKPPKPVPYIGPPEPPLDLGEAIKVLTQEVIKVSKSVQELTRILKETK